MTYIPITTSTQIFDAVWERMRRVTGFKTYRRGPITVQTQPEDLPLIACYLPATEGTPWGDPSMQVPTLEETVVIGISGVVIDSNSDGQYDKMIDACDQLDSVFFRDGTFLSFNLMKAVDRRRKSMRSYQIGETPILEFQWEITISVINQWEPVITDEWLRTHSTTRIPAGGTDNEIAATQQVVADWDQQT